MKSNQMTLVLGAFAIFVLLISNSVLIFQLAGRSDVPVVSAQGGGTAAATLVTVDVNAVFEGSVERRTYQEAIDKKSQEFSAESQKLTQQVRDTAAKLEEERRALLEIERDDERETAEQALLEKLNELRAFEASVVQQVRTYQEQITLESNQATAEILQEINDVIDRKAKDLGYTHVINSNALDRNGFPVMLYNEDTIDLTSIIIEAVNQGR